MGPCVGISCVGAVPLIINLNMKLAPQSPRKEGIKITQSIRVPQLVESLTLSHEGGALEIACNLRNTCKYSVSEVMENAYKKAKELDLEITSYYTTGPTELELVELFHEKHMTISTQGKF